MPVAKRLPIKGADARRAVVESRTAYSGSRCERNHTEPTDLNVPLVLSCELIGEAAGLIRLPDEINVSEFRT
jgi:hypothetical protein